MRYKAKCSCNWKGVHRYFNRYAAEEAAYYHLKIIHKLDKDFKTAVVTNGNPGE